MQQPAQAIDHLWHAYPCVLQVILKVYNADVMLALGSSCSRLLAGIEALLTRGSSAGSAASPPKQPAPGAAGREVACKVPVVVQMEVLPVFFVLFQVRWVARGGVCRSRRDKIWSYY